MKFMHFITIFHTFVIFPLYLDLYLLQICVWIFPSLTLRANKFQKIWWFWKCVARYIAGGCGCVTQWIDECIILEIIMLCNYYLSIFGRDMKMIILMFHTIYRHCKSYFKCTSFNCEINFIYDISLIYLSDRFCMTNFLEFWILLITLLEFLKLEFK